MSWPTWFGYLVDIEKISWFTWFGYLAVLSSVVTCAMKTMIPLRAVSMVCNCCFIVYGFFGTAYPTLLLNLILLPVNGVRLHQMLRMIKGAEETAHGHPTIDWLKPYMSKRRYRRGDVLFSKGEHADAMFCSVSGRYRLKETGIEILPGQIFGELGLISPDRRRTQTLECTEDGEVLVATYAQVKQLYFQNPQFGFYFLELTSERLFQNVARLEEELARKTEALALKPA
jgi:CRP/FNR family transcriptional regulator, cyclic AMP receptor protein